MPDFEPVLLRRTAKKADPFLDAYRADGGYRALAKALNEMTSPQVVDVVKASGLRGRGGAECICGEETGLIESLEGKRGWPRIKPPFPAIEGAFRKPTIVNNVETLACVTHIVDRGADWFKSMGVPPDPKNPRDAGSYGPKLYCISGHVNKPCCVELPLGISVRALIDKHGGGVWKGRKAKGAIPGGISMGLMTEAEFDIALDFNGPGKVGCLGLGTAAVTAFEQETRRVEALSHVYRSCSRASLW